MTSASKTRASRSYRVVEICAGAGGQSLGLEQAGFEHAVAVELDRFAAQTLRINRKQWSVAEGDVADPSVWNPDEYRDVDLLAGGVPCPPFSSAGRQLGASDERDLFAWAVELAERVNPRALLLENVRGLSTPRFAAYRQRVLDRLAMLGYVADWRLLHASDFGMAQLRPRFVLIALKEEDVPYFYWPETKGTATTVGESLKDLMGENGWEHVNTWVAMADGIGPTLVGGSKKHGGADLGPTRAKAAWLALAVDGKGIANEAPSRTALHPEIMPPKLTIEMVARLQGWERGEWQFAGGKTAQYRQIGNAFPPPVARAVGESLVRCFRRSAPRRVVPELADVNHHDEIYTLLSNQSGFLSAQDILRRLDRPLDEAQLERRIAYLSKDFAVEIEQGTSGRGAKYRLGEFKGFIGQENHARHNYMESSRGRIS